MSLDFSTAFRQGRCQNYSVRQLLNNGEIRLYTGPVPGAADNAETGTVLAILSANGGVLTKEVQATGTVTLSGVAGSITSITVKTVEILGATVNFTTDLPTTAALVASQINSYIGEARVSATSLGAVITITMSLGLGANGNTLAVAATAGSGLTATPTNTANGVTPVNGIQIATAIGGVINSTGTIQGIGLSTGNAAYFRYIGSLTDAGGATTGLVRIQGTCGTVGSDCIMASTLVNLGIQQTIGQFQLTDPE